MIGGRGFHGFVLMSDWKNRDFNHFNHTHPTGGGGGGAVGGKQWRGNSSCYLRNIGV